MATNYSEWTKDVGDRWVDALNKAGEALGDAAGTISPSRLNLPEIEVPEQIVELREAVTSRLPKPAEVIAANFELASRLLAAHGELAMKLVEAYSSEADEAKPAAKKTSARKSS